MQLFWNPLNASFWGSVSIICLLLFISSLYEGLTQSGHKVFSLQQLLMWHPTKCVHSNYLLCAQSVKAYWCAVALSIAEVKLKHNTIYFFIALKKLHKLRFKLCISTWSYNFFNFPAFSAHMVFPTMSSSFATQANILRDTYTTT